MRDGETARTQFRIKRLDIAQRCLARCGIADMAAGGGAGKAPNHLVAVEIPGHMPHRPVGVEVMAVPTGDARGFMAAMLERVKAKGRSEEHTSELQSIMRSSYAVFCLKKQHTTYNRKAKSVVQLQYI